VFNTFFVSPFVKWELSCDEDFIYLFQKILRDYLLVIVKLLLENNQENHIHLNPTLAHHYPIFVPNIKIRNYETKVLCYFEFYRTPIKINSASWML